MANPSERSDPDPGLATSDAVRAVVADYRARLGEIVAGTALPHELPSVQAAFAAYPSATSGPMKPALERVFKPMGYVCRGESGAFTLRRRTQANLTAQLYLDVGTWSRMATAIFQVLGVGFKASLPIPVAVNLGAGQYPIGDAQNWAKIVENLAALVRVLEGSFVLEIERAAGAAPEWAQPDS